ncbi:MAG: HAMP domain-containing histidine kinase [Flavobacteriaceae bacterium]|nr:HAMP domain-containing histidine kinase [Flavobacteriaceae bacterium]
MTTSKSKLLRGIGIGGSFVIVSLILWNTYVFFQKFKSEERQKMEILGQVYESLGNLDLDADIRLETYIIEKFTYVPMIIVNQHGTIINWNRTGVRPMSNFDSLSVKEQAVLRDKLLLMKGQNKPIPFSYHGPNTSIEQTVYYQDSELLAKLKYYPIALILILLLFVLVTLFYFRSVKSAENNRLWTGMAKETAHQIGTPLSSLLGWIELLRLENVDENYIVEIEKDVNRLNVIAERFSKIGSMPILQKYNIVFETRNAISYLKSRNSKQIKFNFNNQATVLYSNINLQLFGWVIENLVKNAIDSMKGKGELNIEIKEDLKNIHILISDTGKGIPKNIRSQIFDPGFTTKKRGWGLGLSLSRRIVEEYHKGEIYVKSSEINKGTTFCVTLKKL